MYKVTFQTMMLFELAQKIGVYDALKKVREIGYEAIEISGHFPLDEASLKELLRAKNDFGLDISSMSVSFSGHIPTGPRKDGRASVSLVNDYDEIVSRCRLLDCHYVRFAGAPLVACEDFGEMKAFFASCEEYARRLSADGIGLCMHNHANEFTRLKGKTVFEWAALLAPTMKYELCIFNAQLSGYNISDLARSNAGRVPLIHFEDIAVTPLDGHQNMQVFRGCVFGEGNIDVESFCRAANEAGTEYFILENDMYDPETIMDKMAEGYKRINAIKLA